MTVENEFTLGPVRWWLKKTARRSVAFASGARDRLSKQSRPEPQVRALTYHRFGIQLRDPFCVTPRDFEQQMAYLAREDLAVSLDQVQAFLEGKEELRDGSVLVTIDDGYRCLYTEALPILLHYGIPAVAFVTPGEIEPGARYRAGVARNAYLAWDELQKVAESGIVIGSHAWTHRSLGRLSAVEARMQAVRSKEALEQCLGREVAAFAYPFGRLADFSPVTTSVLREAGYRIAFTSQHGALRPGMDPLLLPRVKVESGEDITFFRQLAHGGLDAWRWVDERLWRVQAGGRP